MRVVYYGDMEFIPMYHRCRLLSELSTAEFRSEVPADGFILADERNKPLGMNVSYNHSLDKYSGKRVQVPCWGFKKGYTKQGFEETNRFLKTRSNITYITYVYKSKAKCYRASLIMCLRLGFRVIYEYEYIRVIKLEV